MTTLALGRASTNSFQEDVKEYIAYGWMAEPEVRTWTYLETITTASADVYVVNVDEDVTGLIGPNLKVRLSNPTVKYFGVLSVGAYADGVTPVYLFGGTDYVLDGLEAITDVSFSNARAPFGFPLSEDKWAIEVVDDQDRSQLTPALNDWYNINSNAIVLPAGVWGVSYKTLAVAGSPITAINLNTTLSTSASSESDNRFRVSSHIAGSTAGDVIVTSTHETERQVFLSSETTFYLLFSTGYSSVGGLAYYGATTPTVIRAVWGGL